MNPLELFADSEVTDILINSTEPIQILKSGKLQSSSLCFSSEAEVSGLAKTFIRNAGARIDLAKPFSEVNIETEHGQLRVHCLLGGECSTGTHISIRRHPEKQLALQDLQSFGSISQSQLEKLHEIVASRSNFAIVGATGSGKTTLLRAMLGEIRDQRIITIEDSPELHLKNAVALYTRPANADGFGEINLKTLVREALRMRPDRLVVGEARGEELAVLLQALNTGHTGVGFTLHANGTQQAISRMLGLLALSSIPENVAAAMLGNAVDYVIELSSLDRSIIAVEKLVI